MPQQGNENLPDFKQLNDRVIARPPSSPIIGIRTNLDVSREELYDKIEQGDSKKKQD